MNSVSPVAIFVEFLKIGATSFGGGVVAYLRDSLVRKKQWIDDASFLELMSISNTMPGLNATNMAILVGDRLGGVPGSIGAMLGMCIPSFAFMTAAGLIYTTPVDRPIADAALRGVAAAAVGLIAATWFQIGKKSLKTFWDALFVILAILGIHYFHLSVPVVLIAVGALAIFKFRPHAAPEKPEEEQENWVRSLR
jgi:chromate transporter